MTAAASELFERARRAFVDGLAALESDRWAEAERHFVASLALLPGRTSTLLNLGVSRLRLGRPAEALDAFDAVLAAEPQDLDAWLHRGDALVDLGRDEDALASFDHVLAVDPAREAARFRRGTALGRLGRHREALACHEQVLKALPRHALAWLRRGQALQALQRHDEALPCYEQATLHDPTLAEAWSHRGALLKDRQQLDEAAACFRQAIAHGGDAELNRYFLASVSGESAPARAPAPYVRFLFDDYAEGFDEHLVQVLHYQAPRVLMQELAAIGFGPGLGRFHAALDLGCGTGLCGVGLRPFVDRLDGVDLAPAMLAQARARGLYDALVEGEVVDELRRTTRRYDLVLAADVFIYIGDLAPVFEGVRRVLDPGGVFCFSVERADDEHDFHLLPSSRYAHSRRYLLALAARHGFQALRQQEKPLREDQRRPVPGLYLTLRRG